MRVNPGDKLTFRGCSWDAHWEFDAPVVVYSPCQRYGFTGSICESSVLRVVENLCIDICIDNGHVRQVEFSKGDLKEFDWRWWNPRGFARRKSAVHAAIPVEFYRGDDGEMYFRYLGKWAKW